MTSILFYCVTSSCTIRPICIPLYRSRQYSLSQEKIVDQQTTLHFEDRRLISFVLFCDFSDSPRHLETPVFEILYFVLLQVFFLHFVAQLLPQLINISCTIVLQKIISSVSPWSFLLSTSSSIFVDLPVIFLFFSLFVSFFFICACASTSFLLSSLFTVISSSSLPTSSHCLSTSAISQSIAPFSCESFSTCERSQLLTRMMKWYLGQPAAGTSFSTVFSHTYPVRSPLPILSSSVPFPLVVLHLPPPFLLFLIPRCFFLAFYIRWNAFDFCISRTSWISLSFYIRKITALWDFDSTSSPLPYSCFCSASLAFASNGIIKMSLL